MCCDAICHEDTGAIKELMWSRHFSAGGSGETEVPAHIPECWRIRPELKSLRHLRSRAAVGV
jgi:hypothetical protein